MKLLLRTMATLATTIVLGAAASAATLPPAPTYPKTAKGAQVDDYFGTKVADPYRWLEDDNSAETKAWVAAENEVTFAWLDQVAFRGAVQERMRALSNYPRYGLPFRRNDDVYFFKNDGLQNQPVLYVQKGLDGKPEVLLDPNTFSSDSTVRLESFTLSRDGRYAAYETTAIPGSDWRALHVLEIATRKTLPETLRWVRFSTTAWRGDGFYYSRYPEPGKGQELTGRTEHQKVYFHRVGTTQADDALVFEDPAHPERFNSVETTEDERYAIRVSWEPGRRGNDLWVRDERAGEKPFRPLVAEIGDDSFDVVDNVDAQLLVRTNSGAPNGRLMRADLARPAFADWATVLPERPEPLSQVTAAGSLLFAAYLKDVTSRVEVHALDGALLNRIELPAPGDASGFGGRRGDRDVFYSFTSMNRPPTIFRYDIAAKTSSVFRAPEIAGFDADAYESRQVFFKSRDGTRVPMFIVYRKGMKRDGRNPTILYGYGGFNITLHPSFSAVRVAWLEQGGVFAMANLRGGGEYGEAWHEAGMRLSKQNVFDDCIAAAEALIAEGYTSPDRLALEGGSNGGLLVGAVINQRPDLFRVALARVGVMDMLRFQKFSVGAAWTADYGSSDDPKLFQYLFGYSPMHNIHAGSNYPATLVTTSDHDDRVVPAHSFKYIATLQAKAGAGAPKLIRIETNSGHGASNLTKALDEAADLYTFTWANMGIAPHYPPR
ncbi:MAG: prolyl oligopeptidase family serine peptidase [Caldimonas sp.]